MTPTTPYTRVNVVPDTPEWEAARLESVGASEVPAILGLSPYEGQTPRAVYRAKKGAANTFDPLMSFVGHGSEDIIAQWVSRFAAADYPEWADIIRPLGPGFMARSNNAPWLHASFDRTSTYDGAMIPWQFKTAHQFTSHKWDEGVPVEVEAQVLTEVYVAGAPFGFAVVWIGGRTFRMFRIDRNDEWYENHLIPKTADFWQHVIDGIEPDPITKAEIAEAYPSRASVIEGLPEVFDWVDQRDVLLADKKAIEAELDPIEVGIGAYMQEHDTLTRDGHPILTYKSQSGRRSVDYATLYAEWPAAYAATVENGRPFKVFRRVKPKEK